MSSLNKDKARDKTKVHRAVAIIKGKKKPRGLVGGVFVDTSNTTRVERESQVEIGKIINRQSIIDNRQSKNLKQSIIDSETTRLRALLQDETLNSGFVAKAMKHLSEYQINSYADYAVRKGSNKGRAFVGLCEKIMREKYAQN